MRLLVTELPKAETGAQLYGPATAAAVLRYKQALGIINTRYQTKADSIVGKMTMKSLDDLMWVLEGGDGPERLSRIGTGHPTSPPAPVSSTPIGTSASSRGVLGSPSDPPKAAPVVTGGFEPPLSGLPDDLQAAIRRSNDAKRAGELMLFPFLAAHEGPQTDKELSKRFGSSPSAMLILVAVYTRMKSFGIFTNIKSIFNTFQGNRCTTAVW